MTARGLYLHVPFCTRKCDYCAFHSRTDWTRASMGSIVEALLHDIDAIAGHLPSVDTLYIGGGTPSTLDPHDLTSLIQAVRLRTDLCEITVEANPETVTAEHLAAFGEVGVSRLSLGVQTLEAEAARGLGRRLTTEGELETIRKGWPGYLSVDLIHGAPGQTRSGFDRGIDSLVDLGVEHMSVYGLGVEADTPLAARVDAGETVVPDVDLEWESIVQRIEAHGLSRYEVSSFARPGSECVHNLNCWRGEHYIGLGPSAVSTLAIGSDVVRVTQPTDHAAYLARRGVFDCDQERLSPSQLRTESLMLGLRTSEGVMIGPIVDSLDRSDSEAFYAALERERRAGLLRVDSSTVRATSRGLDMLDRVIAGLIVWTIEEHGDT